MDNYLGQKIKHARLEKGMTQEELGHLLGVEKSAVAKYENGRIVNLKQGTLKKLSAILEIPTSELISEEDSLMQVNVGFRIKERRKALHMTADELAARIGKDRATVYRYESGKIENIPLGLLKLFSEALEVPMEYFIETETATDKNIEHSSNGQADVLEIILRLHTDNDFLKLVEKMSKLDNNKLKALEQFLTAFSE